MKPMNQYFSVQLEKCPVNTGAKSMDELLHELRINMHNATEETIIDTAARMYKDQQSHIGQTLLYFMLRNPPTENSGGMSIHVKKVWSGELDTIADKYRFVQMQEHMPMFDLI